MKTYVITLSKNFLSNHPRAGEPTGFAEAIRKGNKIHTIRCNFPFWEKRIKEVQQGKARLSLRQWTGKPYRSKQVEIAELTAESGIGLQRMKFIRTEWREQDESEHFCYWTTTTDGRDIDLDLLAQNDGFSNCPDFMMWFDPAIKKQEVNKDGWRILDLTIIHFTPFRYETKIKRINDAESSNPLNA